MAVTVSSIADQLARSLGENYIDLDIRDEFDTWVAQAIDEILAEEEWPFLRIVGAISTLAGQQVYAVPDTIWDVARIAKASDAPLIQTTRTNIVDGGYDLAQSGSPTHWFPAGVDSTPAALVGLWPVPSTDAVSYSVLGTTLTSVSTADTSTELALPPDLLPLIRLLVKSAYYEVIGNTDLMNSNRGQYLRALPAVRKRHLSPGDMRNLKKQGGFFRTGYGSFQRFPNNF